MSHQAQQLRRHSLLGLRGRIICKSLLHISALYVSSPGPDSVRLRKYRHRETERIKLPGKKESRVG